MYVFPLRNVVLIPCSSESDTEVRSAPHQVKCITRVEPTLQREVNPVPWRQASRGGFTLRGAGAGTGGGGVGEGHGGGGPRCVGTGAGASGGGRDQGLGQGQGSGHGGGVVATKHRAVLGSPDHGAWVGPRLEGGADVRGGWGQGLGKGRLQGKE